MNRLRIEAAIEGNLEAFLRDEVRAAERAVVGAVREASDGLKAELRGQVTGAGLGSRLARTWQGRVYENRGIDAAALVFSRAPQIVMAFDEGAVIRSGTGLWLAIPTAAAPKRGVGGKRISPATFPEASLGPLRFVYRRGAPSLLVVDSLRARTGRRGGFRRASASALRTGRGLATVVMFILVPQVKMPRRLDVAAAARRWQGRLPALMVRHWQQAMGDGR